MALRALAADANAVTAVAPLRSRPVSSSPPPHPMGRLQLSIVSTSVVGSYCILLVCDFFIGSDFDAIVGNVFRRAIDKVGVVKP